MNKRNCIYIIVLIICCNNISIFSQNDYGHVSPQTSDFMKYGETPVSLFQGKINLEVPIYTINDRDFNIPISLVYTSDGFKPRKRSGYCGLDWFLNAGGCITREIYGDADDRALEEGGLSKWKEFGFWWVSEDNQFNKNDLWNFRSNIIDPVYGINSNVDFFDGHLADLMPDLFSFNFLNHKGQFMIKNNHEITTNIKGYKIDFSSLGKQYDNRAMPNPSTIRVTTPDGYQYVFGGGLDALEFSIRFEPGHVLGTLSQEPLSAEDPPEKLIAYPTILAWHLKRITAPNGRIVTFNYYNPTITGAADRSSPIWQSNKYHESGTNYSYRAVKTVILESIEVEDTKIEFIKAEEPLSNMYFSNGYQDFNSQNYQLDAIKIKYNNQLLFQYDLIYESQNKRRFLTQVNSLQAGNYKFSYNHTNYPVAETEDLIDTYWSKNNAENSYGLINKVIYPTLGYTTFNYEKNFYGKKIMHCANLKTLTTYVDTNTGHAGGARIRKVSNFLANGKRETFKEYFYVPDGASLRDNTIQYDTIVHPMRKPIEDEEGNLILRPGYTEIKENLSHTNFSSSGILLETTPFMFTNIGDSVYLLPDSYCRSYNIEQPYIGYSRVVELFSDSSKIISYFSTAIENVSSEDGKFYKTIPTNEFVSSYLSFFLNKLSDKAAKRGLLTKRLHVNTNNEIKQVEEYGYRGIERGLTVAPPDLVSSDLLDDEIVCFSRLKGTTPSAYSGNFSAWNYAGSSNAFVKKVRLQHYPIFHIRDSINGVQKDEYILYNDLDLPIKKSIVISSKDSLITKYKYTSDLDPLIARNLGTTSHNILNLKTEEEQFRNSTPIKGVLYKYKASTTNSLLIDTIKTKNGQNQYETIESYPAYDLNDNPNFVVQKQSDKTVYLWGYHGRYIIAEIKNATFSEVSTYLGDDLINSIRISNEPTASELSALASLRTHFTNAFVTTYTHKPLVGMLTKTDPRGQTIYYEYDSFNRLTTVKDNSGNILNKYEYHYAN